MFRHGFFDFTRSYFGSHPTNLPKGWMPDDAVIAQLHDYIQKHGTNFTEADFAKDRDWIRRYLAKEMYTTAFNVDESDAMFSRTDPEVAKAVEDMPKAASLLESAKRVTAQRMRDR